MTWKEAQQLPQTRLGASPGNEKLGARIYIPGLARNMTIR